jgi:hypothetical protein
VLPRHVVEAQESDALLRLPWGVTPDVLHCHVLVSHCRPMDEADLELRAAEAAMRAAVRSRVEAESRRAAAAEQASPVRGV